MQAISGRTRVAGIIGWPVAGSLSPAIHNAAFAACGLDWVYVAFPVPPEAVGAAIGGMRALGIAGLNVTMPHKRAVVPHLDEVAPAAARVGAVNTVVRQGNRLVGTNTDGAGLVRFLERDAGWRPAGRRILVLGAGGAARAVVAALAEAGAAVTVAARRSAQAAEAASLAGERGRTVAWEAGALAEAAAVSELVVNATPLGRAGERLPLPEEALGAGCVVVDLVYGAGETPLLAAAARRGARAFDGLGMLIHQAALAFEAWTGVEAPLEAMRAAAAERSVRS
jgi:shikimate dehydrogenase